MCNPYYNSIIILYIGILFTYMVHKNPKVIYRLTNKN